MNNNDEKMTFKAMNDSGQEVEFEVLFTFESEETGKNYIVYTDNTTDKDGNTNVFASIFGTDADENLLQPIESEEEWSMMETLIEELKDDNLSDCDNQSD